MRERQKKLLEHVFITLPTMVGVSYFVLWACAPPAALPPPVPAMGTPTPGTSQNPRTRTGELGAGMVLGVGGISTGESGTEYGAWTWLSAHLDSPKISTDLGLVVSGDVFAEFTGSRDVFGGGSGGVYLRVMKKRPSNQLGLEVSGGWLWGRLAVPYVKQLNENTWIYTDPGVTASFVQELSAPIGVARQTSRMGIIRFEGGAELRIADFDFRNLAPAAYVAMSGSLRFGKALKPAVRPAEPFEIPNVTTAPVSAPACAPCAPVTPAPDTQPSSAPAP